MNRSIGLLSTALLAAGLGVCAATEVAAHPHVFVTARAEIVYGADGKVTGIRHAWTFDKGYSAFITQGLDTNKDGKFSPDELQPLAKENTESLVDFEYFTALKANGTKQAFDAPQEAGMTFANDEVTLSFLLPLKAPAAGGRALILEVSDPVFFVSFSMAEGADAVKLAGGPKGCATTITRPKPLEVAQQQNLSESFFQALDASANFGAQFANRALVACP